MALLTGRRQIPVARISLFLNETPTKMTMMMMMMMMMMIMMNICFHITDEISFIRKTYTAFKYIMCMNNKSLVTVVPYRKRAHCVDSFIF